jgi:hypothetical protein
MIRILLYSVLLFAICIAAKQTSAQSSCTQYVIDSFNIITSKTSPCTRAVHIVYWDPSAGAKSTMITATCGTTTVFSQCYNTSIKTKGDTVKLTTGTFICCDLSTLTIKVAAYTGDSTCHGTFCYALFSVGGAPLPVYFKNFTATRQDGIVLLQWSTATEENNRGFQVERKIGNGNWTPLSFVASTAPGGNSTMDINYSFTDENNSGQPSFYRLGQLDLDGRLSYSLVREISGARSAAQNITIYPNPGRNGQTTVSFRDITQQYSLTLVDATGRVLKQWSEVRGNNFHITGLLPGWYNLLVIAKQSGTQTVAKFIISR